MSGESEARKAEGARFADNISQGSWTKVAVPSLLISLYASTHGIFDIQHEVPAKVTTLTEAAKVTTDGEDGDVSPEELEQLRELGYAN